MNLKDKQKLEDEMVRRLRRTGGDQRLIELLDDLKHGHSDWALRSFVQEFLLNLEEATDQVLPKGQMTVW